MTDRLDTDDYQIKNGGQKVMLRALFSGVSGLRVHQTKMDVIGNNISNVNTIGFKSSSVTFSDVFYQTTQSASGPNAETGRTGRNAMQIGLGSSVASITASITAQGASQRTNDPFDVMIEGEGFFIVNNGGENLFTKAGSFSIDAVGNLCTPSGAAVMGWQVDPDDPTKTVANTVSPLRIMSAENLYAKPEATTEMYLSGNIDSKDTQLGTDAGIIRTIEFYDSLGHSYTADLRFWRIEDADATNTYRVGITDIKDGVTGKSIFYKKAVTDAETGETEIQETGISFRIGDTEYTPEINTEAENDKDIVVWPDFSSDGPILTFNPETGEFIGIGDDGSTDKSIKFLVGADAGDGANPFKEINIDFSKMTMFANSGKSSIEATKGDFNGVGRGKKVGNMTGVSIDSSGKIYGTYNNGDTRLLGQIAIATFANPAGLEAVGNSMFRATQNSGDFDGIGQDPTTGGGSLTTGVLEMSNVDLSAQFTDMITTQRGFQANSRIITTSDTLLEELINLKR